MKKFLIIMVIAILCLATLTVSMNTLGEDGTEIIEPQGNFELKFEDLEKGDNIIWEWETDQFELDFWIEDSKGDVYHEVFDTSSDSGSLIVPKDGKWTLKWENINLESLSYDYGIKLSYIATIEKGTPSDGGSTGPGIEEPDTDGDGVPDVDDAYPTDPGKWSSSIRESGEEDTFWVWGIVVVLFIILIIAIVTFFLLKIKKK